MLRSLIKYALRTITRRLGYSFLNILGMTLAITSALYLILYVSDELSFDRNHENAGRIYRVQSHITEPDDEFTWIVAQIPFVFIWTFLLLLIPTFLTVSYHSYRAANANPADSIHEE